MPSSSTPHTSTSQATSTASIRFEDLSTDELIVLAQDAEGLSKPHHKQRALEMLVKQNQKKVYVSLYHLAPERNDLMDLTQEVLMRMCRSIGSLRNPKTFKYWLNRIVTNLFYDTLRKGSRQLKTVSMDKPFKDDSGDNGRQARRDIPDDSARPEDRILHTELDSTIQHAIQALPEHFRTVVVLRELQGLSYEEIAELTQTNLGTVKSRLARARGKLQESLTPYLNQTTD